MHGTIHWNELMTTDVAKARAFYAATLGWSYDEMPMEVGTYTLIKIGDEMVGGMMGMEGMPPGMPSHWFTYIAVDDVDARVAKIKAGGGQVLRDPFDVPGVGRIAIVQDPTGAAMGWMTPADPPTG